MPTDPRTRDSWATTSPLTPTLFAADDPAATAAHLITHESLARLGITLELAIVICQALTALWFYRLFRPVDTFAAGAITLFGTINAVMVLCSAGFLATALETALAPEFGPGVTPHLMYVISTSHPTGWLVLRAGWAHRALGWLLLSGASRRLTPSARAEARAAGGPAMFRA